MREEGRGTIRPSFRALSERFHRTAIWATVVFSGAAGLWVGIFPQVLRLLPANY